MTAKEAREKALENNTKETNALYIKVMTAIKIAVDKGLYTTRVDFNVTGDLFNKLKSMGYEVKNKTEYREDSYCDITW